jgi:hypothetical protein
MAAGGERRRVGLARVVVASEWRVDPKGTIYQDGSKISPVVQYAHQDNLVLVNQVDDPITADQNLTEFINGDAFELKDEPPTVG